MTTMIFQLEKLEKYFFFPDPKSIFTVINIRCQNIGVNGNELWDLVKKITGMFKNVNVHK